MCVCACVHVCVVVVMGGSSWTLGGVFVCICVCAVGGGGGGGGCILAPVQQLINRGMLDSASRSPSLLVFAFFLSSD